jgi:diguanylate cyclase (GGDEF)-like protein
LLKYLATILEDSYQSYDVLARVGGDEFIALLPRIDAAHAEPIAERIGQAVENSFFDYKRSKVTSTVSIGLVNFPDPSNNIDELMEKGDKAIYISKNSGRNIVSIIGQSKPAIS